MNNNNEQGSTGAPQERAAAPVAYLHEVVAGDGVPDQALSFAPDNFPLAGTLGYRSISHRPLCFAAPTLGSVPQADDDLDWKLLGHLGRVLTNIKNASKWDDVAHLAKIGLSFIEHAPKEQAASLGSVPQAAAPIHSNLEVLTAEAKRYRDLTNECITMGYPGLVDAVEALRKAAYPSAQAERAAVPDILFDGNTVYAAMDQKAHARTSANNVSDVLDAVVRLLRRAAPVAQEGTIHASDCAVHNEPAMPKGPCDCATHPTPSDSASVDTAKFLGRLIVWAMAPEGPEQDSEYQGIIAHIESLISARVATAQGMADCMHMVREELIEAGIIDKKTAPMFITEAVMRHIADVRKDALEEAALLVETNELNSAAFNAAEIRALIHSPATSSKEGGE